jgi:hypothetical protein
MIGHYPLGHWGSSNIFWAFKQAEYANALWNFIWIFFTLYKTICSVIGQSKKKVILYYTWKKKKTGELTGNDFSATVPWTTSEILKVVICLIKKKKSWRWKLIISDGFKLCSRMFQIPSRKCMMQCMCTRSCKSITSRKKQVNGDDFSWNEKSYQHIHGHYFQHYIMLVPQYNPDQSWTLRCAVLIFLWPSRIKELNPSLEYTRKIVVIKE